MSYPPTRFAQSFFAALLAAVAIAGCGREGTTDRDSLEVVLTDLVDERLDETGSFTSALDTRCDSAGPETECLVAIAAGPIGFQARYQVSFSTADCFSAAISELERAAGRDAEDPLPESLEGCVS